MPKRIVPERDDDGTPLTQPIDTPKGHHVKFEYEHSEARRCHLCGHRSDHMLFKAEEIWFNDLHDRAKHILERHQDNKIECDRASIILGFEALWNQYSEKKEVLTTPKIIRGINPFQQREQQPYEQQYTRHENPKPMRQPFNIKKALGMAFLVGLVLYGIYVIILLSQGYTF